jgi:acetate kinase
MISLIINPWSTNIKISVFDGEEEKMNVTRTIEEVDEQYVWSLLDAWKGIECAILRVVHGGSAYVWPTKIDAQVIQTIESLSPLAPLHNPLAIYVIRILQKVSKFPLYAVFDTAFHTTIPGHIATISLPQKITEPLKIKKYGFHGISHEFVAQILLQKSAQYHRIISLHLGGGSSVCAISNGKSIDTSMGFSPSSGLIMNTRAGDLNADAALYCLKNGYSIEQLEHILSHESGLLGLSGYSANMREIQVDARKGNADARLAFDAYIATLVKYIWAYTALLGWVDAISFTGGIGEGSGPIKQALQESLKYLGIALSKPYLEDDYIYPGPTKISTKSSKIDVWVVPADENRAMLSAIK